MLPDSPVPDQPQGRRVVSTCRVCGTPALRYPSEHRARASYDPATNQHLCRTCRRAHGRVTLRCRRCGATRTAKCNQAQRAGWLTAAGTCSPQYQCRACWTQRPPLPDAPALDQPPQGFHADLRALLGACGWSARQAALAADLSDDALGYWWRHASYPREASLERLITALTVPPAMAAAWRHEAQAGRQDRHRGRSPSARQQATVAPQPCLGPGPAHPFIPTHPGQDYCSRACAHAPTSEVLNNPLKQAFARECKRRSLSRGQAEREIGLAQGTVHRWLARPNTRLGASKLAAVAAWLHLPVEVTIADQHGTLRERQAETAKQNSGLGAFWTEKKYAQARQLRVEHLRAARQSNTAEHRANISKGQKAYWAAHPGEHPPPPFADAPRARALATLRNFRWHHPDWSPEQVEAATIEHLTRRWGLPDRRIVGVLLHVGRGPRAGRGRAAAIKRRHGLLLAQCQEEHAGPWDPKPYGFFVRLAHTCTQDYFARQAADQARGQENREPPPPGATELEHWCQGHIAGCLECAEYQAQWSLWRSVNKQGK